MNRLRDEDIEAALASDQEWSVGEEIMEADIHDDMQSVDDDLDTTSDILEASIEMDTDPLQFYPSAPAPPDPRPVQLGNTAFTSVGQMLVPKNKF